tara:strand:- start:14918 stop:15247 length:330 start_codon:yes stop_codon:yes gene_type:complete
MNYTWQILQLGKLDQTNSDGVVLADAIVSVKWKKIATSDTGVVASYVAKTTLSVTDTTLANFIELDDITKDIVVGWIEGSLSETEVSNINGILAKKVEQNAMSTFTPNW